MVVNVLPLTPQTRDILDVCAFAAMPSGSFVVNIGRGAHVVDGRLVAALDSVQLGGAMLDVFREEPLPTIASVLAPSESDRHPACRGTDDIASAETQVIENIRRLERGDPPLGVVDRSKGY